MLFLKAIKPLKTTQNTQYCSILCSIYKHKVKYIVLKQLFNRVFYTNHLNNSIVNYCRIYQLYKTFIVYFTYLVNIYISSIFYVYKIILPRFCIEGQSFHTTHQKPLHKRQSIFSLSLTFLILYMICRTPQTICGVLHIIHINLIFKQIPLCLLQP